MRRTQIQALHVGTFPGPRRIQGALFDIHVAVLLEDTDAVPGQGQALHVTTLPGPQSIQGAHFDIHVAVLLEDTDAIMG
jgi:hypothetical protein